MIIRKRWIALLVLLVLIVTGCSQTPKVTRVAGTIVDGEGKPIPRAGLLIGSAMTQADGVGQFSITALSGENQAIVLANGQKPEIIPLNLSEEPQTITLTARGGKPTKRSGSAVDYIILFDSIGNTDLSSTSPFTYLAADDVREAARIHTGILNLGEAAEYLSPRSLHSLCEILKARHLVWINKDLKDHLQIFDAQSHQITSLPFRESRGIRQVNNVLREFLQADGLPLEQRPEATEAKLAREVTAYMERMYDITYTGPDMQRIRRIASSVIAVSERPNLRFTFGILETPEYNAYALPGGYIFITRPLLEMVGSDAELAAVIAHESAHITHMHAVRSYERRIALTIAGVFLAVATGDVNSSMDFVELIGNIVTSGYSKEQEYDADGAGLRYIARAGYDSDAMLALLTNLRALEYRLTGGRRGYSRTHPATANRIKQIEAKLPTIEYYRFLGEYLQTL